jgi:DNA-directed RNA polymerase I, II, and III subunit RPABC3
LDVNGDQDEDAPKKVKRELWRSEDQGLAADYEYVMYGKVRLLFLSLLLIWSHKC